MLVGRITPILEGTAMETGLGTKDLIDLRGGYHTKELLVVILMKTDLLGREPCLLGDKLLKVGLKFLRREFLGLCSKK